MAKGIYEQFDAAFSHVSAYAIAKNGTNIGRICFKHPADGAGRLYCYAQVWGAKMARGFASGGGYDKRTAAAECAVRAIDPKSGYGESQAHIKAWQSAIDSSAGYEWSDQLEKAGYEVFQVIG